MLSWYKIYKIFQAKSKPDEEYIANNNFSLSFSLSL